MKFMNTRTWNQYEVKRRNKSLVLKTINNHSSISRADIASQTGLNKGTVSSLVSELLDEDIIYESGPGKSSGGRRPVMLLFNNISGYSIGIDLGVNYILGILTDLQGNICHEEFIRFENPTYDFVKEELISIIDKLITSAPDSTYGIVGIGVGVPGLVNNNGKILLAPNLQWKNIYLREILTNKYKIPIIIENEANAGAYGEKKYGKGIKSNHIVYVSIGIGIGGGLVLNENLYNGMNGFAGELGHMSIQGNGGKRCRCGRSGCWELYASEQALDEYAKDLGIVKVNEETFSLEYFLDLAENGDERAIRLFQQLGYYIGIGLNNIVNVFNPEQIIIGGRIASAKKWLVDPLDQQISQTLWFQKKDLQLNFSKLASHSSAIGAAAFSTEAFIQNHLEKV